MKKTKYSFLQVCLTVLYVSSFLISNIITGKQMLLPGGITMTCAIFIFPLTYILSDIFSEVYGYRWSRITCYMAFLANLLMVAMFTATIKTAAPGYWDAQAAYETVLGNSPRIVAASLAAYVVGDMINDRVFAYMKSRDGRNRFGLRAILSSLAGELTDSIIFIPLAFIGTMPIATMAQMLITQVALKVLYEIIILPATKIVVRLAGDYEVKNYGE